MRLRHVAQPPVRAMLDASFEATKPNSSGLSSKSSKPRRWRKSVALTLAVCLTSTAINLLVDFRHHRTFQFRAALLHETGLAVLVPSVCGLSSAQPRLLVG